MGYLRIAARNIYKKVLCWVIFCVYFIFFYVLPLLRIKDIISKINKRRKTNLRGAVYSSLFTRVNFHSLNYCRSFSFRYRKKIWHIINACMNNNFLQRRKKDENVSKGLAFFVIQPGKWVCPFPRLHKRYRC